MKEYYHLLNKKDFITIDVAHFPTVELIRLDEYVSLRLIRMMIIIS